MTDTLNLLEGLDELTQEQKTELLGKIQKNLAETKTRYLANARAQALKQKYDADMNAINWQALNPMQRARTMQRIKMTYRAQGLEVW